MDVESCVGYCITKNYNYAGLGNGKSCYCDSAIASTAKVLDLSQCNTPCTGNKREFCGSYQKLLVYKKDPNSVDDSGNPSSINSDNSLIIKPNTTAPA